MISWTGPAPPASPSSPLGAGTVAAARPVHTRDGVGYYGLTPEQAQVGGLNPKMFNSFLDGSKPAIESTAVCNATGLTPAPYGLAYPPASIDDLPAVMRPRAEGGQLHHKGQVEVVSSLERDGQLLPYDIRGVGVFEGDTEYIRRCFTEYGVRTDPSGRYACLYKRWHLIGLEVGISVASIGVRCEPTGCPTGFRADAVATAKRDLKPGEILDGEGGYTVVGRLLPAADSLTAGALPLGLAHWKVTDQSPRASWCAGPMWWWMRPTAPCACAERWSRSMPRRRTWW